MKQRSQQQRPRELPEGITADDVDYYIVRHYGYSRRDERRQRKTTYHDDERRAEQRMEDAAGGFCE